MSGKLVKSNKMLMRLDAARRALAEAITIDQVKEIRDQAQSVAHYLKQRDYSLESQQDAAEIKIRAERKLGEILSDEVNHNGSRGVGNTMLPTIPEGVTKHQSHRWQRVASLPQKEFEQHLAKRRELMEEITTAGVLRAEKDARNSERNQAIVDTRPYTTSELGSLVRAEKKFGTIYADPPWRYGNQGTRASTDNHYPTMTVDEIAALPIKDVAADNAHLHLWTTNAFLFDSRAIIESWGFEYKSCFLWVKPQMGIGNYWRVSHEFLLLGVRGDCPFLDRSIMSWLLEPRTKHSRKPKAIRKLVEKVSPGPRLELFGRSVVDGWTVWGDDIEKGIFDNDSTEIDG